MPVRTADARWEGALQDGHGSMKLGSGAFQGQYSYGSRFEEGTGTNPEELIGAAHAGCFSMFLSGVLGNAGHVPEEIATTARVHLDKAGEGFAITRVELQTRARVPGLSEDELGGYVDQAKENCPVSKALAGPEITVSAELG